MKTSILALGLAISGLAWGSPQDDTLVLMSRGVDLQLHENLGLLKVQFKVKNPTDRPLEGEVSFSAPPGGAVYEASLLKHISSTERKSKVVSPDQAAAFYALAKSSQQDSTEEALTGQALRGAFAHSRYHKDGYSKSVLPGQDPAILEYVSQDRYRLRFFPVPPHDDQTVTYLVAFEVSKEGNAWLAKVPLGWDTPMKSAVDASYEARMSLRSSDALGNVTCSSHRLGSIQRDREAHRFAAVVEASAERSELVLSYSLNQKAKPHDFSPDTKADASSVSVKADEARALRAVRAMRALEGASESVRPALGLSAAVVSPHSSLLVIETSVARDLARSDDRSFRADSGSSTPISEEDALQCDFIRAAAQLQGVSRATPCGVHTLCTNSAAKVQWAKENELTVGHSGVLLATSSVEYVKHGAGCPLHEPNPDKLRKVAENLK
jgi:hypothetical protein